MKLKILLTLIITLPLGLYSQKNVGIGTLTPAPDAVLELSSSDKGLLVPRLTTAERNAIGASSNGLLVYDTDASRFFYWNSADGNWQIIDDFSKQNELLKMVSWNNATKEMVLMDSGGTYTMDLSILSQMLSFTNDTLYLSDANEIYLGEYHKDSSSTNEIQGITRSSDSIFLDRGGVIQLPEDEYWNTDGNLGTTAAANYIGTNDNQPLVFRTNGIENMRLLSNGRLGIGTATPVGNLEVSSPATTGYATRIRNMAPNLAVGSETVFMQGRNAGTANQAEYRFEYEGNESLLNAHAFGFSNIPPFVFFNANTRAGIGTNVPDEKLDVDGNIELSGGNREIHTEEAAPGSSGASIKVRGSNHNNLGNFAVNGGDVILEGGSGYNIDQGRGGGHVILRSGYNDLTTNDGRRNGGYIIFQTGGAASAFNERARMLDNGNFGLGTTAPTAQLDLTGQIRIRGGAPAAGRVLTSDANGFATWQANANGDITQVNAGNGLGGGGTGGSVTLNVQANNGLYVGGDAVRLGGNLLQNTFVRHGNFPMIFEMNGTGDFLVQDNGTPAFRVFDNGDTRIDGGTFFVDNSTNMVGVGINPTHKLDVFVNSTANPTLIYRGRNASAIGTRTQIGSVEYFNDHTSTIDMAGGSRFSVNLNGPAAYLLQLATNSAAKPGSNAWTVASDARLKSDVNPYMDGLESIKQINPVYFKYNGKANIKDKDYHVGVVAQELEKVAPYMVGTFETVDGSLPFNQQESSTETYKSVDNGAMTYMLVNAVKELDRKVEYNRTAITTISDFGMTQINGDSMFIPFSTPFVQKLESLPIVTVTTINSINTVTILSQSKTGFVVKVNGETNGLMINWIAMAKVKVNVSEESVSESQRQQMLEKVKAKKAKIDYEREYKEAELRKKSGEFDDPTEEDEIYKDTTHYNDSGDDNNDGKVDNGDEGNDEEGDTGTENRPTPSSLKK